MRFLLLLLAGCGCLFGGNAQAFPDWPTPAAPAVLESERLGIEYIQDQKGPEAIAELTKAANAGSATALYRLAQVYFDGLGEQWPDKDQALKYLDAAAEKNQVEALFVQALVGNMEERDIIKSMDRAATLGMAGRVFDLGLSSVATRQPFSVPVGIGLMESAARAGYGNAMPVLGRFYMEGNVYEEIPADLEKSEMWLQRAIRAGYIQSISDLLKIMLTKKDVYPEEKYKWLYLCHAFSCEYLDEHPQTKQDILKMLVLLEQQMLPDTLAQTKVEINSLVKRIQRAHAQ